MAWADTHKGETRERILTSAADLFLQQGFENVSIDLVMKSAGLTRGAFYSHFSSKAELYMHSILFSAQRVGQCTGLVNSAELTFEQIVESYLSESHVKGEHYRCPLAFLVTDITQQDQQVREAYTQVFKGFLKAVEKRKSGQSNSTEKDALQSVVLLIGGMAIARALNDSELVESLLSSCRQALIAESVDG